MYAGSSHWWRGWCTCDSQITDFTLPGHRRRNDDVRRVPSGEGPRPLRDRRPWRAPRGHHAAAVGVLPLVRRRQHPRTHYPGRDDRDLVARDRGVPDHRPDQRPNRGYEQIDQTSETRRYRVQKPGELPTPSTVALHPAHPPIVSEETDGARLRSKSPEVW